MANTTTLPGSTRDRVLAAAYAAKIPTNLEGLPGVGKTAILNAIAGKWGFHMETLILSIHEAEDISGLPFISPTTPLPSGRKAEIPSTQHTVPSWAIRLSHVPAGALFLDEFSTAEPRVSKAALRVVNERYVGEHQLPDTTWMLAAMNPPECAVDGTELAPPMANRFLHLKWEASASAWLDGAASGFKDYQIESVNALTGNPDEATQARMAGAVVGYIRVNPSRLNPGVPDDPDKSSRGWASSRSWSNLIAVMKFIRPDDHAAVQMVAKGLIGEGEGTAFYTWFKAAGLYDPMDVLAGRVKVNWSKDRPDVLYALCEAMVYDGATAQPLSATFMDYALPRASDFGDFDMRTDESIPCRNNLLGVKGVGELGTIGATPCVVNAIADALARNGHAKRCAHLQMPLTPARLWEALQAAG